VSVLIKDRRITGLNRTFNDNLYLNEDGLIALAGSHGYLEVVVQNGNAAELLQAGQGETVTLVSNSS
jgi:S-adenosylmethionine hydrolase